MDQSEEADFEIEIFTAEEITRILAAVRDDARPALAIGAFAGIRMAEVCRLDWAEVSLEKGLIEIKKGKAKTRSRRLVPITENLALFLKDVAHRNGPVWPNSELVRSLRSEPVIASMTFVPHFFWRIRESPRME